MPKVICSTLAEVHYLVDGGLVDEGLINDVSARCPRRGGEASSLCPPRHSAPLGPSLCLCTSLLPSASLSMCRTLAPLSPLTLAPLEPFDRPMHHLLHPGTHGTPPNTPPPSPCPSHPPRPSLFFLFHIHHTPRSFSIFTDLPVPTPLSSLLRYLPIHLPSRPRRLRKSSSSFPPASLTRPKLREMDTGPCSQPPLIPHPLTPDPLQYAYRSRQDPRRRLASRSNRR